MKRNGELAHLYKAKSEFLEGRGCVSGLGKDLGEYASLSQINNSIDILEIGIKSELIGRKNDRLSCKLF